MALYTTLRGIHIAGFLDAKLGDLSDTFLEGLLRLLDSLTEHAPIGGDWEVRQYPCGAFALALPSQTPVTLAPPVGEPITCSLEAASLVANLVLLATLTSDRPGRGAPDPAPLQAWLQREHPEAPAIRQFMDAMGSEFA